MDHLSADEFSKNAPARVYRRESPSHARTRVVKRKQMEAVSHRDLSQ
jgi:hypothetical protein